jgi:hypothetical protein
MLSIASPPRTRRIGGSSASSAARIARAACAGSLGCKPRPPLGCTNLHSATRYADPALQLA